MKLLKVIGATSEIWQIFIQDSSSTTGAGLTGLTNASGSLTAYFHRDTDTTATAISLVTMTVGTFTSSGFKEIDATNMPGFYQFCPPNTALASGAKSCAFMLKGATNMAPLPIEVQLTSLNVDDVVRAGMTALPNVASGSAGAIPTTGSGANQINVSGGVAQADAAKINGVATTSVTTISANVGTTQPVNFTGTGASALAKGDTIDVGGTAQTARDLGAGVIVATNNDKTGYALTSAERNSTADALLDRTDAVEPGVTPRGALRLSAAGASGNRSGFSGTTPTIAGANNASKTRITAAGADVDGNTTSVTVDTTT